MKKLEHMKDTLVACVEGQLCNLDKVNAQELGAAVDMIKDLEEAIYYCTITKAMNEPQQKGMMQQQQQEPMYYPEPRYNTSYMEGEGKMYRAYYGNGGNNSSGGGSGNSTSYNGGSTMYANGNSGGNSSRGYQNMMGQQPMMRDPKEGRSPMYRAMYMTSKEMNGSDSSKNMKELEEYVHELTEDIMEMIEGASPEEKQMLRQKISTLSTKIK